MLQQFETIPQQCFFFFFLICLFISYKTTITQCNVDRKVIGKWNHQSKSVSSREIHSLLHKKYGARDDKRCAAREKKMRSPSSRPVPTCPIEQISHALAARAKRPRTLQWQRKTSVLQSILKSYILHGHYTPTPPEQRTASKWDTRVRKTLRKKEIGQTLWSSIQTTTK